jgi:SPP1 family predicted phage head-tail adaptor
MQNWTIKLISQQYVIDEIGNQKLQENYIEVPITEIQDVYQSEFYNASQQGLKPTLRVVVNNLNYNDEEELYYMDKRYTIIRVDRIDNEYVALVCEKRVGYNGKKD